MARVTTTSPGNFHCFILYKDEEEFAKVQAVVDAMIHKAIALDGTCASKSSPFIQFVTSFVYQLGTGEHGVGMGKKRFLVEELGEETVALMKTIKSTLDPLNLFNPGKVSCLAFL